MTVRDVAEFTAIFEVTVNSVEHADDCVSAETEDVLNFSALKVIDNEVSD